MAQLYALRGGVLDPNFSEISEALALAGYAVIEPSQ
jgi:hypothetical protein